MEDFNDKVIRSNTSCDKRRLASLIKSFGRARYMLDSKAVKDDISKLQERMGTVQNKAWISGAKSIISYLNKILTYCDKIYDCSIRINSDVIKEFPIRLNRFPQYDIKATDYIVLQSSEDSDGVCSIISYNFDNMLDALAVEVAKFDFGLDMTDIESKLEDCNIISVNDGSRVVDMLEYDDHSESGKVFRTACEMAIGESEYANRSKNNKIGSTFFRTEVKCDGKYREILEKTANELTNILITRQLLAFKASKLSDIKLLAASSGLITYGIGYGLKIQVGEALEILSEPVELKLCGRVFKFEPDIEYVAIK